MHHYPAEPGSTRSIVAPHMYVPGTHRDMLKADADLTRRAASHWEAIMEETLAEYASKTGQDRADYRSVVRYVMRQYRAAKEQDKAASARFYEHSIKADGEFLVTGKAA